MPWVETHTRACALAHAQTHKKINKQQQKSQKKKPNSKKKKEKNTWGRRDKETEEIYEWMGKKKKVTGHVFPLKYSPNDPRPFRTWSRQIVIYSFEHNANKTRHNRTNSYFVAQSGHVKLFGRTLRQTFATQMKALWTPERVIL